MFFTMRAKLAMLTCRIWLSGMLRQVQSGSQSFTAQTAVLCRTNWYSLFHRGLMGYPLDRVSRPGPE